MELDSEVPDFRAASELLTPFRELDHRELEARLTTYHHGRKVPKPGASPRSQAAPPQGRMMSQGTQMARGKRSAGPSESSAATIGYEAQLWQMADALRGSMDAAEYKHVVLGLIFLKYISDAFEEQHAKLVADAKKGADAEDPDEYRALSIFWVPPEARWPHLKAQARQPTIGQLVDDAMAGIERDNPALEGVLPKDYARPALDKTRLGQLIDMMSNLNVGDEASRAKDVLGQVYQYFLKQFALAEGRKGGEFWTPKSVVQLLVEMIEPYRGRVYDPCCGTGGMFVQSVTRYVWGRIRVNNHAHALQWRGTPGAVQPKLSQGRMNTMLFVFAGEALCRALERTIQPWFAGLRASVDATRTHAALRDVLLPKLISGDLRVKDAAACLERATV
jgi:hypothetical protein